MNLRFRQLVVILPLFAACCSLAKAQLTIDPIYDSTITSDPNASTIEASIGQAISNIEGDLANPVTVNITFSEMSSGLGESNTSYYLTSYSSYLTALQNNQALSSADNAAIASLGNTTNNPVNGNANIEATQALLEALRVNVQGDGTLTSAVSGTIGLNTSLMNLSRTGTQNPNDYDLQAVVAHEVDEILGTGGAGSQLNAVAVGFNGETLTSQVGPTDLFRYSAAGVRSYTTSSSAVSYFSVDGGVTKLVNFNQNGSVDGSDFGDWGNGITPAQQQGNTPPQVQDAYGAPGAQANLGKNELTALDTVGWDLTSQGAATEGVPEPDSVYLFLGGLIALGVKRRLRSV